MRVLQAILIAALEMTATSVLAFSETDYTRKQKSAIFHFAIIDYAGRVCPRYEPIESAMENGLTEADIPGNGRQIAFDTVRASALNFVFTEYGGDLSALCFDAWQLYGPGGTHSHQMLREKLTCARQSHPDLIASPSP